MEYWDAYDKNLNKIKNKTLVRGEPIPDGIYHLVCEIAVRHTDGTYLLMQRDFKKKLLGGLWELSAGGSALQGEAPLECAMRELKEETGIISNEFTYLATVINDEHHSIYFEYLCLTDCNKDSVTLQNGETINSRWITSREFHRLNKKQLATTRIQNFIKELKNEDNSHR